MTTSTLSVLIIGATGRTGLEILRQFSKNNSHPDVHAFCRDPSKLSEEDRALCRSVRSGDARSSADLEQAIDESQADFVVVCVGNGDSVAKTDIRTSSAQALVRVLELPQHREVRTVVVSSNGAGPSRIKVGMGIGKAITYHLRHVLADHTGQEAAFESILDRTVVLRPTSLGDGRAMGKVVEFGDKEKPPTININRQDVAMYAVEEVCDGVAPLGNKVVNITNGAK